MYVSICRHAAITAYFTEDKTEMKNTLLRLCAALLVAVALMCILPGCNTAEHGATKPSGSTGSTEHTAPDGADATTGAAGNETIAGTETTAPSTTPTTAPATQPTEPETEPPTQPTVPATEPPTQPTEPATEPPTQPTEPATEPPTQPSEPATEPMECSHSWPEWAWEEYTYTQDGVSRVSHRKVRTCTKCGYKETGGTPDHYCARGSDNHVVTTVKEGTCSTKATMRSTCKVCGWYVEYAGSKGKCNWVEETRHLTDYGPYTNELDAVIYTCTGCGETDIEYVKGEGWSDYNRYEAAIAISGGAAYSLEHPEYQTVRRDFVYGSDGYVAQFTLYWWYNGSSYSQIIRCDKASLIAWFAEYGLDGTADGVKFQIKTESSATPWKVSWTS